METDELWKNKYQVAFGSPMNAVEEFKGIVFLVYYTRFQVQITGYSSQNSS